MQPDPVGAEVPCLRGLRGAVQRVCPLPVVGRQFGGLLEPPLRLAGQAAQEAHLGEADGKPIPFLPAIGFSRGPRQTGTQFVGDPIELRRPPDGFRGERLVQHVGCGQAPLQMPGTCVGQFPRLTQAVDAVLTDRLQHAISGAVRFRHRDQQTLIGERSQRGGDLGLPDGRPVCEQRLTISEFGFPLLFPISTQTPRYDQTYEVD